MRVVLVLVAIVSALFLGAYAESASTNSCRAGSALAFATIRPDPFFLVGTIPSTFTGNAGYFARRFNCTGGSAQVRRVDLGRYDVRFPGLTPRTVIVTATSDEGVSASAQPLSDGIVRIALRGPLVGGDVMARRDVPFSLVIY